MKLGITPRGLVVGAILLAVYWIIQAGFNRGRYLWGPDKNFSTIFSMGLFTGFYLTALVMTWAYHLLP
ncbi:MAG: hypothetical protein M1294_06805 [Firmicutes bacterium]|jgi:hypothetical protein|uniref:Uncharacterized protein n=1 Tax=Sulfobacillus benefaciens TaxID=453960 RepID=A0A2T2X0K6_9FIRM|nr:hypothetical protein [Bacillota bacterium]MCL5014958.1 hypothetical protein [Bacillota bacterium]PSR28008.1 MAG: hypothetical protein C7B43_10650 [Sulfobacillus benefaciens]HBQ94304.1 hypothetical protein [Sulfobacillus sp.]